MLNVNVTDRRRVVVAVIATLVAVPSLWLVNRSSSGGDIVAATQPTGALDTVLEDPLAPSNPVFLEGPTSPQNPVVVQIGIPSPPAGQRVEGTVVYQRNVGALADTCSSALPFNVTMTVQNLNNGREVTCVNRAPAVLPAGQTLMLSTEQFLTIADLADSPIPAIISWK